MLQCTSFSGLSQRQVHPRSQREEVSSEEPLVIAIPSSWGELPKRSSQDSYGVVRVTTTTVTTTTPTTTTPTTTPTTTAAAADAAAAKY